MKEYNYRDIREIVKEAVNLYPDNNAFIIKNPDKTTYTNITFKKFEQDINSLTTALLSLGLKGKRIAVIGKNRYEWALGYYTVLSGLGILVPLDKGLPESEVESSIIRAKADAIIFEENYYETIKNIIDKETTKISKLICMDKINEEGVENIPDLIEKGRKEIENGNNEYEKLEIDNEATSIILFTSGTTSMAKAVELSHKNIAANISSLRMCETVYPTDVNMAFLPFHHAFGSTGLLFFLSNGAATVFCDGIRYIAKNLKEYKVSVFFCVPLIIESMHKKIWQEIERQGKTKTVKFGKKLCRFLLKFGIDIRRKVFKQIIDNVSENLRFVISGAAGLDKKVSEDFNDFGILTVQGYGLSETSPVLTAENEYNLRYGSIGKPIPNVEIRIDNPDEKGVGEIVAKAPNVMKGYYENEEATKEVLKDGWFYTGDLGYQDKDGFLYVSGRKKNVIVLKNGKNIYPEELELLISNLPYVAENIVFGIPKNDDLLLATKIVYNKEYIEEKYPNISKEDLHKKIWQDIKDINSNLTVYKHIKKLFITDEPMIKTTTNKIKRNPEIEKTLKEENI